MAFDPFRGYTADVAPSVYDVQRRQALAKQLLENQVQNAGPWGALANTLAGIGSGYQNKYAAEEAQQGLTDANSKLGSLLAGEDVSPGDLITAGGNPFLPDSETGLVSDLIKRKMGIGEDWYGNIIKTVGPDGKLHAYQFSNLGGQRPLSFGPGETLAPDVQYLNQGDQFIGVPKQGGAVVPGAGGEGVAEPIPINNAQAASDTAYGGDAGHIAAGAPETLQKEGQLLQTLDQQHDTVTGKIDDAMTKINKGDFNTGFVGDLAKSIKGTPQFDLYQDLLTIQANIGFDTLQNMRNNSPTGGALGAISDKENDLLQAVNGSLEQGQSKEQLTANLKRVKTLIDQVNALKHQAYESDKSRLGSNPKAPPVIGGDNPSGPGPSGKVLTYNSATGELE